MKWIAKTRVFSRWMRKAALENGALINAVAEMSRGLVDADLGGGIFKKRIAAQGRGKRGGSRILIATNRKDRWFFIFGFEKNDRENITQAELAFLQRIARDLLECSDSALEKAIRSGELQEVRREPDN